MLQGIKEIKNKAKIFINKMTLNDILGYERMCSFNSN